MVAKPLGDLRLELEMIPSSGATLIARIIDGSLERISGDQLDPTRSAAFFERRGTYRRVVVTVPGGSLFERP